MLPSAPTIVVADGAWGAVEAVVLESRESPALKFLEEGLADLREGTKDEEEKTARARFMFLFQHMANYGYVAPKRLKSEMDGFSAFRHEVKNSQIRFPCFPDGRKWILTHGFIKPGAKKKLGAWPESEVRRAIAIRDEYYRRKLKMGVKPKQERPS